MSYPVSGLSIYHESHTQPTLYSYPFSLRSGMLDARHVKELGVKLGLGTGKSAILYITLLLLAFRVNSLFN